MQLRQNKCRWNTTLISPAWLLPTWRPPLRDYVPQMEVLPSQGGQKICQVSSFWFSTEWRAIRKMFSETCRGPLKISWWATVGPQAVVWTPLISEYMSMLFHTFNNGTAISPSLLPECDTKDGTFGNWRSVTNESVKAEIKSATALCL